jgi:hypothetical protein
MRQAVDGVSMKGWVCDDCVIAFWENVWVVDAMARRKAEKGRRR